MSNDLVYDDLQKIDTRFFFEHFPTFAAAPDGIARLRELILQFAVRGELGTQDPNDEPAQILLKRIHEQNKRIILRNGERKFKLPDPVSIDAQNGEIPSGWYWTKLQEIVKPEKNSIKRGPFGSSIIKAYFVPKGYKIYEQKNAIYNDFSIGNYYVDDAKFEELKDFEIKPNDIIISCAGTVGKLAIAPENIERGIINQALLKITLNNDVIKNEYFKILFSSFLMRSDTLSDLKGTAMKNIVSLDLLRQIIFPLPPLAEQHRIVEKVDRLMIICDELEARQQQERAGCLRLGTASLAGLQNAESPEEFGRQWAQVCDAFDLILDCPENVAVLRQTIFHLAVHGRLMQQMPQDEPAEKLLERIRTEKERLVKEGEIKREKPIEPVLDHEIPFVIPDSWKWVRINDAAKIVEYGTSEKAMPSTTAYGKNSVPVFRMNNIQDGKVIHENLKYLPNSMEELPHLYLQNNDILINRTNSYELVGKAGIFKGEDDKFTFASYLIRISFFPQLVDPDFVNITLNASYFRTSQIEPQVTQQCGQANFSGSKIKNALIPFPPLAEQHRIVAKVDVLMALCDALESRLKERAGVQGRLAGAVGKQVAGGA